jgi:hypothetical protein
MTTGTVSPLAERAGLALPHTEVWPDCATLGATLKSATTFCRFVVLSMSSLKLSNSQTFHLSSGGYLNNKRQNSRNKMAGPSASSSSVSSTVSIGSFIQQLKPKVFVRTIRYLIINFISRSGGDTNNLQFDRLWNSYGMFPIFSQSSTWFYTSFFPSSVLG